MVSFKCSYIQAYYNLGYIEGVANIIDNATIDYTYHTHSSSCYRGCTYEWTCTYDVQGYDATGEAHGYWHKTEYHTCGLGTLRTSGGGGLGNMRTGGTSTHKDVICGKTESTIESAIITFD